MGRRHLSALLMLAVFEAKFAEGEIPTASMRLESGVLWVAVTESAGLWEKGVKEKEVIHLVWFDLRAGYSSGFRRGR